ncbi:Bicyclomycin resistance protein [bacterium HR40]|nr:Bicyclomycin resistance protein [bacterium HR40]
MRQTPRDLAVPSGGGLAVLLTALVAFQAISTDLYLPSLPAIVRDLATDIETVQLTLSLFLLGFGAGQLLWGPLSDRFGRRPVLLAGLCLYVVAGLACALVDDIASLVALRLAQGMAASAGPVLGRAVVRDLWGPRESARVLSYLAGAMAVAPMVGPILGGWLTALFGWRANFLALAAFGAAVLAMVALRLGETNPAPDPLALRPRRLLSGYLEVGRHPAFFWHALAAGFVYSGIFCFISGSPYVLIELSGLAPPAFGAAFATAVAGYMLGGFAAGRLHAPLGPGRTLRLGATLCTLAGVIGFLETVRGLPPPVGIVAPAFAYFLGAGMVLPGCMAGAIAPFASRAGLASGLLGAVQLAIGATIGVLLAALYDGTARPMMGFLATSALATLWTVARATRAVATRQRRDRP